MMPDAANLLAIQEFIAAPWQIVGIVLMSVGLAFDLFGCIGLVRLPDVYNRLQAATKCVTLGTCLLLVGVCVYAADADTGIKAVLCAVFILLTSPVGAHALARGAHRGGVKLWEGSVQDAYLAKSPQTHPTTDAPDARPSEESAE
jgi:multicomponent Na+:H+ antiporter subunit G